MFFMLGIIYRKRKDITPYMTELLVIYTYPLL